MWRRGPTPATSRPAPIAFRSKETRPASVTDELLAQGAKERADVHAGSDESRDQKLIFFGGMRLKEPGEGSRAEEERRPARPTGEVVSEALQHFMLANHARHERRQSRIVCAPRVEGGLFGLCVRKKFTIDVGYELVAGALAGFSPVRLHDHGGPGG